MSNLSRKTTSEKQKAQRAIFKATRQQAKLQPKPQADHMATPKSVWNHRGSYFAYFGYQHFPQHDLPEHGIQELKLSHLRPIKKHVEQHHCFPKLIKLLGNGHDQDERHRDFPKVDPELAYAWFSTCGDKKWENVEETADHRAIMQRLSLALDRLGST